MFLFSIPANFYAVTSQPYLSTAFTLNSSQLSVFGLDILYTTNAADRVDSFTLHTAGTQNPSYTDEQTDKRGMSPPMRIFSSIGQQPFSHSFYSFSMAPPAQPPLSSTADTR